MVEVVGPVGTHGRGAAHQSRHAARAVSDRDAQTSAFASRHCHVTPLSRSLRNGPQNRRGGGGVESRLEPSRPGGREDREGDGTGDAVPISHAD